MSSGVGDGGRSKKKAKRAYFKRAASSNNSAAFDPVHSNCQFLVITADQGKERQCGHEMAAWCSDIVQEKFPQILTTHANTTATAPHALSSSSSAAATSTSASSAVSQPASIAVSVSDELDQELRALQQSDGGKKRRRQELDANGRGEDMDSDDAGQSEADDNVGDEKSTENGEKPRKDKKSGKACGPKEIIFAVSPTTVKVRGVVVLALNAPLLSANELFEQLFSDVLDRGRLSCRLSIRAFPVLAACFARMDSFEKLCQKVIPSAFQSFPSSGTFSIVVNRRGNNAQMNRDAVIKMIASIVPNSYSVNLSSPNIFILVELVERMAAIGCIKNNEKIPNFNLRKAHEIYLQKNMTDTQILKIETQQNKTNSNNKRTAQHAQIDTTEQMQRNNQQQYNDNDTVTSNKDNDENKPDAQTDTETDSVGSEFNKLKKAKTELSS